MKTKRYKIGQRVTWIGAGKISRLDGMRGKKCYGTVVSFDDDGSYTVRCEHESLVPNHSVEANQLSATTERK